MSGRRVVLVFTDGDDTASKIGLGKVIDRARAEEVMIYAIGLAERVLQRPAAGAHAARQRAAEDRRMKPAAATSS